MSRLVRTVVLCSSFKSSLCWSDPLLLLLFHGDTSQWRHLLNSFKEFIKVWKFNLDSFNLGRSRSLGSDGFLKDCIRKTLHDSQSGREQQQPEEQNEQALAPRIYSRASHGEWKYREVECRLTTFKRTKEMLLFVMARPPKKWVGSKQMRMRGCATSRFLQRGGEWLWEDGGNRTYSLPLGINTWNLSIATGKIFIISYFSFRSFCPKCTKMSMSF